MTDRITHITKVRIEKLWGYEDLNFEWHLNPDVNVLAGDNGSGKSTILNLIVGLLKDNFLLENVDKVIHSFQVEFNNSSKVSLGRMINSDSQKEEIIIAYDVNNEIKFGKPQIDSISTFDQPLLPLEILQKLEGEEVETHLDLLIKRLEKKYLNYQIDIGKRAIEALSKKVENSHSIRQRIDEKKNLFFDIMDSLFKATEKRIDREENGISFIRREKDVISPYHLSSGEKQMLIILLTALVQDNKPAVMIMDEPEASLHTDWQENLIDNIRKLNENVQIIIATHSPSIIINGWQDKVFETVDIQIKK